MRAYLIVSLSALLAVVLILGGWLRHTIYNFTTFIGSPSRINAGNVCPSVNIYSNVYIRGNHP